MFTLKTLSGNEISFYTKEKVDVNSLGKVFRNYAIKI